MAKVKAQSIHYIRVSDLRAECRKLKGVCVARLFAISISVSLQSLHVEKKSWTLIIYCQYLVYLGLQEIIVLFKFRYAITA